jgi:hypothetical protein
MEATEALRLVGDAPPVARMGPGAVFVGGLLACLAAANLAVARLAPDVEGPKHVELYAGALAYRTILLGTSHVFHGVDPHGLERPGLELYDFGIGSGNPTYFRAFYQDIRRFCGPPATILFGLDPLLLKRFPWSHRYAQDSGYWPWPFLLQTFQARPEDRATIALNAFALVRQREVVQDATAHVRPRAAFVTARAYHGFVPLVPDPRPGPEGTDFPDDPAFAADLPRLFADFQADSARVVCFQTPEYLPSTGDHRADNVKLAAIARRFGYPFLDYNGDRRSAINQDPQLFNDGGHLNVRGCDAFTPVLRRDLDALGAL